MPKYYDRYADFRANGNMTPVPGIVLPSLSSDKNYFFHKGKDRLDKISLAYYNTPYCGWLIMLANPEFGGLEFLIPDLATLRIPFPFESAIDSYITEVNTHITLYGQ